MENLNEAKQVKKMIKYKYKHQLLGGANTEKIKLELEKNNIPAEVFWKFPVLTIYCNRKNVLEIQKTICFFRNKEPIAYKNHLYGNKREVA